MESIELSYAVTGSPTDDRASLDELGSQIIGLAGRLAASTCRWLLLVAQFDARDGCRHWGLGSTSRWLSHACGLSRRTALEHVRVARGLAAFPALVQAMSAGRLSYSHVRAITRLAKPGETQLVADLIEVAEHASVGQVESAVRRLRSVEDNEVDNAVGAAPLEYLSHSWTSDSRWRLAARLDPERGALVQSAVAAIARAEGISYADALVRMAEIALAAVNDGETKPRDLRGDERAAVVIHLDASALPAEAPDIAEPRSAERARPAAHLTGGPGLPDRVMKRLLCAGRIRTAVHGTNGNVLDLGRSRRLVSDRQYRALLLRDGGCAHPGCGATRGLEAHHVRHWLHGGRTDLKNLVLLCRRHHHAHHDGEFAIERDSPGRFRFTRPDGTELLQHVDPASHIGTDQPLEHEHHDVAKDAATTRWTGEPLDTWSITVLADRRERHRPAS
jgi:hypothetical protein